MIPIQTPNEKILAIHFNAIFDHFRKSGLKYNYEQIDNWFKGNGLGINFQDVILADFNNLKAIKKAYVSNYYPDEIHYLSRRLYTGYFANSEKGLGPNNYSAANLVEFLEIKVCPYCNRNYINNIYYGGNGVKRTCQIDHFFCKEKYPFLAMSFLNLIPSCSTCNHIKSNLDVSYSPYNNSYSSADLGLFNYKVKSLEFIDDINHLDILFNSSAILQQNKDLFRIEERYEIHKDLIQQIFKKKLIYTDIKIKELYSDFEGLFKKEEELRYLIYGDSEDEKDFLKKPLSKLVFDINNSI